MDLSGFEKQLPEGFEMPSHDTALGKGVHSLEWSGKGVSWRFCVEARYLEEKSKAQGFDEFEEVVILMFYKKTPVGVERTPVRLRRGKDINGNWTGEWELPRDLNVEPYKTGFKHWKEGREQLGTSIERWGVLDLAQQKMLTAKGIWTVEKLAELSEDWIRREFPERLIETLEEWQERAMLFVAAKDGLVDAKAQGSKIMVLEAQNEANLKRIAELEAMVKGQPLEDAPAPAQAKSRSKSKSKSKSKAKSPAAKVVDGEIVMEGDGSED